MHANYKMQQEIDGKAMMHSKSQHMILLMRNDDNNNTISSVMPTTSGVWGG